MGKLLLSKRPVGTITNLAERTRLRIWKSWQTGAEDLLEPWVKDVYLPQAATMMVPGETSHVVQKGNVWKVLDKRPDEHYIHPFLEEYQGEKASYCSKQDFSSPGWDSFTRTVNLQRRVEAETLALASQGCQFVIRVWRQRECMIDDPANKSFVVFAEIAFFGITGEV